MQTQIMSGTRWQAPGTCGELVQGAVEGHDFLVNCPIGLFSTATIRPSAIPGVRLRNGRSFGKVSDAIVLASREHGLDLHHEIHVHSPIPRGKGMASSTADISAALEAVCRSCDKPLCSGSFARLLTSIEPSDCVHVPGIAHVNHLNGEVLDCLPPPRGLRVVVADCGGEVNTLDFDRESARAVYRAHEGRVVGTLALLKHGLRHDDLEAVAMAATESARLSQMILRKPQFEDLLARTTELGALGVNCAHSGTVLGVLYREGSALGERITSAVEDEFDTDLTVLGDFPVIGGGCFAC